MKGEINSLDQVGYIRRYTLTGGKLEGLKIIEVNNGVMRFIINESKCLDIAQLWHEGTNISYLSKNGLQKDDGDFLKRFEGGMLYTCGIDVIGNLEGYVDHGSVHNIPANVTRVEIIGDELLVEGEIRDSALFGKNLVLKRKIHTSINSSEVTITDTLTNNGFKRENYSVLYHVNVGYPMLDDGVKIVASESSCEPRNSWAQKNIDKRYEIGSSIDNADETCYYLSLNEPTISVVNEKLKKTFSLSWSSDTLPYFVEWKSLASGDYALGLEPSTSKLDDEFKFSTIDKDESIEFKIVLKVSGC